MSFTHYQEGSIARVKRAKGPDVWVYRYRSSADDNGERKHRSRVPGTVKQFPQKADAQRAAENLRSEINATEQKVDKVTVNDAWGDFQKCELRNPNVGRSPTTIAGYGDYFKNWIIPTWGTPP